MQRSPKLAAAVVAVASAFLSQQSAAFPSGAGCCDTGPGVLGPHAGGDSGSIQDGKYEILVNEKPPTDFTYTVCKGQANTLTIKTASLDENLFLGFRARMDVPDAFDVPDGDEFFPARVMETGDDTCNVPNAQCPEGVSGITHTGKEEKTEIEEMQLTLDEVGAFGLEITVVKSVNEWFYSTYSVEVEECEEEFTTTPPPDAGGQNQDEEFNGDTTPPPEDGDNEPVDEEDEDVTTPVPAEEGQEQDEDFDGAPTPPSGDVDDFEEEEEEGSEEPDGDEEEEEEEEDSAEEEGETGDSDEDECNNCPDGHKPWWDQYGGCFCRFCDYECPEHSSRKWGRQCYDNFHDCRCDNGYRKWNGRCAKRSSGSTYGGGGGY